MSSSPLTVIIYITVGFVKLFLYDCTSRPITIRRDGLQEMMGTKKLPDNSGAFSKCATGQRHFLFYWHGIIPDAVAVIWGCGTGFADIQNKWG
jgi:hypothetical protein